MAKQLISNVPVGKTLAELRRTFGKWGKTFSVARGADRRTVTLEFDYLGRAVHISCYSQATYELNLRQVFLVAAALHVWDERGVMAAALGFFEQIKDLVGTHETEEVRNQDLLDAYGTLGVAPETPLDVIESLWKGWAKRLHPDLITDPDEKREKEAKLARINGAWEIIQAARR